MEPIISRRKMWLTSLGAAAAKDMVSSDGAGWADVLAAHPRRQPGATYLVQRGEKRWRNSSASSDWRDLRIGQSRLHVITMSSTSRRQEHASLPPQLLPVGSPTSDSWRCCAARVCAICVRGATGRAGTAAAPPVQELLVDVMACRSGRNTLSLSISRPARATASFLVCFGAHLTLMAVSQL